MISAKLKLPKEVSFASPSTHPLTLTHPNSSFSYLSRTPLWFGVLLTLGTSLPPANQPTNQPRASLMLLLQISGRLLVACLRALLVDAFFRPPPVFLSSFFNPLFLYPILRSTPLSVVSPMLMSYLPSMPVFTFYFMSRSFIIFLISRGYPFVRDNCRKWEGSGRVDGKRFFVVRSNLALRHVKILYLSCLIYPLRSCYN